MWPGEQSPTGAPDPRQPNPYLRPGYRQPSPYAGEQQPGAWNAPTVAAGGPPGRGPRSGRTKAVAMAAAGVVVVAAAVTGVVLLGGDGDGQAGPGPTASSAPGSSPSGSASGGARDGDGSLRATVAGWTVVANPGRGLAFDVPPSWVPQSPDWVTYVSEDDDPEDTPLAAMKAPAVLKEKWCASDDDRDGSVDHTPLASAGTRGNNGARSTEEIARTDSAAWVYGGFTQPDRDKVTTGPVTSFTTASGIKGSLATSRSSGVVKKGKCDVNGKATTFAFKAADGDLVSWSFFGAAGVADEVPDTTVRAILATVREYTPSDS
ncbi:hypothetical protein [Streptomyces sp. NRRL F-5650]|uniref:hypothetical protein n=1 Tax=Streptomyces sp. NRRL F-5650 TaxID=1463868 RepID=UPI0004CA89E7|nr:hypothetical protein [Streptomyces sp. NRRL F-5650]